MFGLVGDVGGKNKFGVGGGLKGLGLKSKVSQPKKGEKWLKVSAPKVLPKVLTVSSPENNRFAPEQPSKRFQFALRPLSEPYQPQPRQQIDWLKATKSTDRFEPGLAGRSRPHFVASTDPPWASSQKMAGKRAQTAGALLRTSAKRGAWWEPAQDPVDVESRKACLRRSQLPRYDQWGELVTQE
jgi:hypothetical protein